MFLPEMQAKGRTLECWCALCSKAPTAQVSSSFLHFIISLLICLHDLICLHFHWRSSEAWHSKRPLLLEAVKSLLDEQNLAVQKAISEVYYY